MITNEYLKRVYDSVEKRDPDQPEFLQAVREVFESLQLVVDKHPEWEKASLIERYCGARARHHLPRALGWTTSGKVTG